MAKKRKKKNKILTVFFFGKIKSAECSITFS